MKIFRHLILITMLCAVPSAQIYASVALTEPEDSIAGAIDLNELVITGTRTPKSLKDTPIQTRLITRQEIARADATDIADLLQQEIPGIEMSYAMNQQTNLNFAGFAGQNVLILLDGERLAGETMDNTDFSRLSLNGISRIEIIRGAASALYGSNATGGVINIISANATEPWRLRASLRGGSHNQWRANVAAQARFRRFSNSLDLSFDRMSTYTVCLDPGDECDFRHVYGYHTINMRDRLVWQPLDNLKLTGRAGYYFKQRLYNPDTPDRYRDFSAGLKGEWTVTDTDHLEVSYAFDQYDKSDLIKDYHLDIRDYSNVQNSLHALYTHAFAPESRLLAGADFMRDRLASYQFSAFDGAHHQYTADAFLQYDHSFSEQLEVVGAARWDFLSDGNVNHVTAKASGRYRTGDFSIRAGYAGGFRAPTLKERYMDFDMAGIFDIHGNYDLKSEKSHNFNASVEFSRGIWYFTAGGTLSFVTDRITTSGINYDAQRQPFIYYLNVDRLKVYGADATVRAHWKCGISASLSYNFTHEQTRPGSFTQYCPARPHSLNAKVGWSHRWSRRYATDVTLTGRFLSAVSYNSIYMYEPFDTRRVTNPAYTLWKLQVSQRILSGITVTLAIDNLLNYTPAVYTLNAPVTTGATFYAGVSIDLPMK